MQVHVCVYETRSSPRFCRLLPLMPPIAERPTLTSLTFWTCLLLSCDPRVRVVYTGLTTVLPHSCLTLFLLNRFLSDHLATLLRSYVAAHRILPIRPYRPSLCYFDVVNWTLFCYSPAPCTTSHTTSHPFSARMAAPLRFFPMWALSGLHAQDISRLQMHFAGEQWKARVTRCWL